MAVVDPPAYRRVVALMKMQEKALEEFYKKKGRAIARIIKNYKLKNPNKPWVGNRTIERKIKELLNKMDGEYENLLENYLNSAIDISNESIDRAVNDYTRDILETSIDKTNYFFRDSVALSKYARDRAKNRGLSPRVWSLKKQTQKQMEALLKSNFLDGDDAPTVARNIQQFLLEPNRLYRRVRNKDGQLKLSAPARAYKSGRGIYRSSYKNALRVARTETNMAYRRADQERAQRLDFVTGIHIKLSKMHPRYDICDELQGKYPKTFRWGGWHPQCLCYMTFVVLTKQQFIDMLNNGTDYSKETIKRIPKRAQRFLSENREKLRDLLDEGKAPYWARDNQEFLLIGYNFREAIKAHNANNGSTFDSKGYDLIGEKGMASVSIYPERSLVIKDKLTAALMGAYAEKNADLLESDPNLTVGTWYNEKTGETYLDIVAIAERNEAIRLGIKHNQIAIFDLENLEEINTGGTGEAFVPAETLDELHSRILEMGVQTVDLSDLDLKAANVILDVLEKEARLAPLTGLFRVDASTTIPDNSLGRYNQSKQWVQMNALRVYDRKYEDPSEYIKQIKDFEDLLNNEERLIEKIVNQNDGEFPSFVEIEVVKRRITEEIERLKEAKIWSVSYMVKDPLDSFRATMTHEMGHFRHLAFDQLRRDMNYTKNDKKAISQYQKTDQLEWFAEWYAYWRLYGEENEHKIPADMLKIFKKMQNL